MLAAGVVSTTDVVLTAGFVPTVGTPVTFVGVVVFKAGFVPAGVLFVVGVVKAD